MSEGGEAEKTGPGKGWRGDSERHREAGKKGGATTAKIPGHLSAAGKKGGSTHSAEHMREIGRRGGLARRKKRESQMSEEERFLRSV